MRPERRLKRRNGGGSSGRPRRNQTRRSITYWTRKIVLTKGATLAVVDGYLDCLRVRQAGFPWVVALMGSSLSAEQERVWVERFERVVLMLDRDPAGRTGSRLIRARLSERCLVGVVSLPDGAQPDRLSPAAIREWLHKADQDCLKQDDEVM